MKICIITILGYSLFSTILIWLSGALDDTTTNGESLLALACGPVLWALLILADIVDAYRYFKEKKYILTKSTFDRFVKVKWPMKHLYKNIWLIRFQPGSKFSTWQIHVVKDEAKTEKDSENNENNKENEELEEIKKGW